MLALDAVLVAVLVALVARFVPRLPARHRAMLWWLVGAKLLVGLVPIPAISLPAPPSVHRVVAAAPGVGVALVEARRAAPADPSAPVRWSYVAWAIGAAVFLLAAVPEWRRARAWRSTGRTSDDENLGLAVLRASHVVGLRRVPRVLVVPSLSSPLVTGLLRPTILVPADAVDRLTSEELELALAHEMTHVARGDLWLGLVPAIARRVFFFHPVAWIAEREFAVAREAACDEFVLRRRDADAFAYGRLLVRLATGRPLATTLPMSPHSMLRRRLEMIESVAGSASLRSRLGWALVAAASLAVVPVRLVAEETADGRCLALGPRQADTAYVVTHGDDRTVCGDMFDVRAADRTRTDDEDVVWFRIGDERWVVRDPATVAAARRLFAGAGAVIEEQAAMGEREAKIGETQATEGERLERMAIEKAAIDRERAEARRGAAQAQNEERRRAEQEQHLAQLQAERAALADMRRVLAARQEDLGARIEREVVEAQRKLAALLERAIEDGRALRAE